ncbi:MAG TPA: AAA family ATPase, partial [Candidatus Hydrogenedentes bacterium]|nr:AAA family ATPase [Candidatus Hydrogenedentota bacterium]
MLETLRIQNYALIDAVEMDFRGGFNALTGETGAGKSILIGALELVLGARASGEMLREGADRASIEAVFRVPRPSARLRRILKTHDIETAEGELLLSRTLTADGRSRGYVSGVLTPLAVLAEIGDELVDLHGQHEHQSLLKPDRQLDLLDAFGGAEKDAAAVADQVEALRALDRELAGLETDYRERVRQLEFLRFEVNEIDAAAISPGEEEEVRSRLNLITNAEQVYSLTSRVYALLYENEDQTAIDLIAAASHDLDELASIDERFRVLAGQLAELRTGVEAVAGETRGCADGLEFDPQELERLNARLALLRDLKRKYGGSIEEILAYREKAA